MIKTKKEVLFVVVCLFLLLIIRTSLAQEKSQVILETEVSDSENIEPQANEESEVSEEIVQEEVYSDIGEVELKEGAGLTPDNPLYFVDDLVEQMSVGENPELALAYKEEKIAEVEQMVEEGKSEEAKEALEKAEKYGDILEREVSPDIEKRARESSKAVKEVFEELEDNLEGDEWKEVKKLVEEHSEQEDKIALAAKISAQIKQLCETLAKLDPLEYSKVCRTEDDDPKWHRKLDKELTEEQAKEAEEFFEIMSQCFKNPKECRCSDIKIKAFAEKCSEIAPLAAECMEGIEESCEKMENIEDPIDLLPDYLQEVMERVESEYGDSQYEMHVPKECREAGASDRKSCMKVMFKIHAPEECIKALEEGIISITSEMDARKQCEEIMFREHAPEECINAGVTNPKECGKFMFRNYAPEECVEAGLTGESRTDEKRCRELMENKRGKGFYEHPGGFDCRDIKESEERLKCYDSAIEGVTKNYESRGQSSYGGWPKPCIRANTLTRESCERTMQEFGRGREGREGEHTPPEGFPDEPERSYECEDGKVLRCFEDNCECVQEYQPEVPENIPPDYPDIPEEPEAPPEQPPGGTGGFIQIDNRFFDYYFR